MVIPINIVLQLAGIRLMGSIMVRRGMLVGNRSMLGMAVLKLVPVHENIFAARSDRMLTQMHDEREFDAIDLAEMRGKRVNVEVARCPFVAIPFHVVGIGIHDIGFTNRIAVNLDDNFQISRSAVKHIELDAPPANIESILEIIDSLKKTAQLTEYGFCVVFSYLHSAIQTKSFTIL